MAPVNPDKKTAAPAKQPLLWASALRIIATLLILFYHFNSMYEFRTFCFDILGIGIFCFISGFFTGDSNNRAAAGKWLLKRFWHVMIPYWLVIFPVLVSNHFLHYKPTTLTGDFVIAFGGAMFLADPVYVLSWFITLILIFYLLAFLRQILQNNFLVIPVYLLAAYLLYEKSGWRHPLYLALFLAGTMAPHIRLLKWQPASPGVLYQKINKLFFEWQAGTYHFFLIHGAVLVGCIRIFKLDWPLTLLIVFAVTIPAAWLLKNISVYLERRLRG